MLTKRDYWTITILILVVVILFQLINVTRRSEGPDGAGQEVQSVAEEPANGLSVGDEYR